MALAARWDNVLLLQTSFLGDTILTLPLVEEIRASFPTKKLTLLCRPEGRDLLQDHPAIDEIIVDDKKNMDRGLRAVFAKGRVLKSKEFTLALSPHKSLRSALMLYLAQIPCRVGFRQSKGWFLFHHRADREARRHDVERNLSILAPFGRPIEDCRRELNLPVSGAVEESVNRKLGRLGVSQTELLVGINPGSVWPTKRWSAMRFAELIVLLKKSISCQVLLFGGPEDASIVEQVQRRCGDGAINLVNQISLRELPSAIGRCALFITNDSGPMHIAVARKVPTVAIFCATTPELGFFPYTSNAVVLGRNLPCRPCGSHGGRRCPLGHADCSEQIEAKAVLRASERLLQNLPHTAAETEAFQPRLVTV